MCPVVAVSGVNGLSCILSCQAAISCSCVGYVLVDCMYLPTEDAVPCASLRRCSHTGLFCMTCMYCSVVSVMCCGSCGFALSVSVVSHRLCNSWCDCAYCRYFWKSLVCVTISKRKCASETCHVCPGGMYLCSFSSGVIKCE